MAVGEQAMPRASKVVVLIACGAIYTVVAWFISATVLTLSAMANGPCETDDCPEGVAPSWAWGVPIFLLIGLFIAVTVGVRWAAKAASLKGQLLTAVGYGHHCSPSRANLGRSPPLRAVPPLRRRDLLRPHALRKTPPVTPQAR